VLGGSSSIGDEVLEALGALAETGTVTRQSGADRFATSAAVSRAAYPSGASTVYLATGGAFPDALAAGPVAGVGAAPLLLTARDTLPAPVAEELARLRPQRIVVVGGQAAVSDDTFAAAAHSAGIDG
jgi:peptidoglycan-N-acetylglucosamine deacetylase